MTTRSGFRHNLMQGFSAWSDWIIIIALVEGVFSEQTQNADVLIKSYGLVALVGETVRGAVVSLAVLFIAILLNLLLKRLGAETAVRCGAWAAADLGSWGGEIGVDVTKSHGWGPTIGTIVGIVCFAAGYALTKYCARQVSRDLQ